MRRPMILLCVIAILVFGVRIVNADQFTEALIRISARDYTRAIDILISLANQGNAKAQLKLGRMYSEGKGVSRNHFEAVKWFRRAADQGNSEAEFALGVLYAEGLGVTEDHVLALQWFRRAAEKGAPHAQNAVGELYLGYQDIPQDYVEAITWFMRAARLGDAAALYNLGVRYAFGQGVRQDNIEAYRWFDLSATAGLERAHDKAVRARTAISERMMPGQIEEAKRSAREWFQQNASFSQLGNPYQKLLSTRGRHHDAY